MWRMALPNRFVIFFLFFPSVNLNIRGDLCWRSAFGQVRLGYVMEQCFFTFYRNLFNGESLQYVCTPIPPNKLGGTLGIDSFGWWGTRNEQDLGQIPIKL